MSGGFPNFASLCNSTNYGLGTGTIGTQLVSGSAGMAGAWTQLAASLSSDVSHVLLQPLVNNDQSQYGNFLQLGIGNSGSEVPVIDWFSINSSTFDSSAYSLPLNIQAGIRVAARCLSSNALDKSYLDFTTFDGGFAAEGVAGYDTIGLSGTTSTTVTSGAAADTKGSFTQIIASTSRDYCGIVIVSSASISSAGALTAHSVLDVAIGASGAEQVIISNLRLKYASQTVSSLVPLDVPSGNRLALRLQSHTASDSSAFIILGAYK